MTNQNNNFKNIFEIYSALLIPIIISICHKVIKILYIKCLAKYYELEVYYFEHVTLDYFFSSIIIFSIFLFIINSYNISLNNNSKNICFIFLSIISFYYISSTFIIINSNIISQDSCIIFFTLFMLLLYILKKLYPAYILYSVGLLIIISIVNFSSIKLKKEYEIGTLRNYEKIAIIILQNSDYLTIPFEEKESILYLKTKERRWINRLEFIKIETRKYQQIKINSAPI